MPGQNVRTVPVEVLVIGSGGAGLRAAIAAHDAGAQVTVLGRTLQGKAHTVMAEGGINAALGDLDPEDSWIVHAADTLKEGEFLSHPEIAERLARDAPERLFELERWGAVFDRTPDGRIMQRPFGAHTYRRTCHVGDRTGLELVQTLLAQVRKRGIDIQEEIVITSLLTSGSGSGKRAIGATAVNLKTGEFYCYLARAVVLASGGYARVYKITSSPGENFGHGPAMAYRAGAELMDMEMVQFHPTGMTWPETAMGILVTEAVRGEGGVLKNSKGERFMTRYDAKRMELSARDIVARAIYTEVKEGRGTPRGAVYLDISHKPAPFIRKKLAKMVKMMQDFQGVDITKEPMEIAPTAHYAMGGIRVEPDTAMTSLSGLFATGEVASGVHGANRLGGNSLTDLVVFGNIAGKAAAEYAKAAPAAAPDRAEIDAEYSRITTSFGRKDGISPAVVQEEVRELMWQHAAIERSAAGLEEGLAKLQALAKRAMAVSGDLRFNPGWLDYLDAGNALVVCEAILRSALMRQESRGAHMRTDFPEMRKDWKRNIICVNRGRMLLKTRPLPEIGPEVRQWMQSRNMSLQ